MTHKQRAFAQAILQGKTATDAYLLAYDSTGHNRATAKGKGYQLSNHPEIMAYIAQERAKTAKAFQWTREEMLETLKDIALKAKPTDRTRAIAQASKMMGFDAPQKIEGEISGGLTITWQR